MGHAADSYHRIDIRQTSRHLVVRHRDRIVADTKRPMVLYESGSRRAGTFHVLTLMSLRSLPWNARLFARTRAMQLLQHR